MVGGGPVSPVALASRSTFSALNDVMACDAPSSNTLKSDCFRSVTGRPLLSQTRTSTRTRLVWLCRTNPRDGGAACGVASAVGSCADKTYGPGGASAAGKSIIQKQRASAKAGTSLRSLEGAAAVRRLAAPPICCAERLRLSARRTKGTKKIKALTPCRKGEAFPRKI